MIEPENNEYIKNHIESYVHMNENLGRYDKLFFDKFEEEITMLERSRVIIDPSTEGVGYLKIKAFSNHLHNVMEQLVYYPLKSATERYIIMPEDYDQNGTHVKIIKDLKLFEYLIFIYIFHASESLGIWTKEDRKTSFTQDINPPEIPGNIKTQEVSEEEKRRQVEDFFKNPFSEAENEQSF